MDIVKLVHNALGNSPTKKKTTRYSRYSGIINIGRKSTPTVMLKDPYTGRWYKP